MKIESYPPQEPLSEIGLLSIISATGPQHHRLIARRANLPAPVVTALSSAAVNGSLPNTVAPMLQLLRCGWPESM